MTHEPLLIRPWARQLRTHISLSMRRSAGVPGLRIGAESGTWILLLLPMSLLAGTFSLTVPDWTWEPDREEVSQHCLSVPNVTGIWYNESITWRNNSRLLSVAVPKGTPPPGGWPVMVDLLVIDYPSLFGQPLCGLDGYENRQTNQYPASKACEALGKRLCGDKLHTDHYECAGCFAKNRAELLTVCEKTELNVLQRQCPVEPPPEPLNKSCTKALTSMCNWTFSIPDNSKEHRLQRHNCTVCVLEAQRNLSMGGGSGCPQPRGAPHSQAWNESSAAARRQILMDFCYPDEGHQGGGMFNHGAQHVRDFGPFVSPQRLAMGCSCINGSGSKFRCSPPYDDDQHGHPFVPPGGFCSFDVFAGGLWSQRLKQYLLNNGIAIVEANNYVTDGWESWDDEWEGGYDAMFFKQFAAAMSAPGVLSSLDPHRVAFRGWSGSAQMVSWLINQEARGNLPGLRVKAGVMMAGGSHACYNWPGHGAINNCANCNATQEYTRDPNVRVRPHTVGAQSVDLLKDHSLPVLPVRLCAAGFRMLLDGRRTGRCGRATVL